MSVRVLTGTSGYSYDEWRGNFYPEKIAARDMLRFYAGRFPTVEINNTFYRMPREPLLQGWADQVPEGFSFVIKAPQRITHIRRLKECGEQLTFLFGVTATLGARLGPLLFQLPPNFRKDVPRLRSFFAAMPDRRRVAIEFRHASWFDDDVYERLRARNLALCVADSEKLQTPVEITADYAYFRLRDEGYTPDDIARWADIIRAKTSGSTDVFVYFKHEESGKGPEFGRLLMQQFGAPSQT